jgi:hypothetical protein
MIGRKGDIMNELDCPLYSSLEALLFLRVHISRWGMQ